MHNVDTSLNISPFPPPQRGNGVSLSHYRLMKHLWLWRHDPTYGLMDHPQNWGLTPGGGVMLISKHWHHFIIITIIPNIGTRRSSSPSLPTSKFNRDLSASLVTEDIRPLSYPTLKQQQQLIGLITHQCFPY